MAKQSIPQASYPVNNVRLLPDQVKGDAPFVKETFDKGTEDGRTYINNTLIPALNGNTGANMIGLSNSNLASNNVADGVEEVRAIAVQAQAGELLPNSVNNTILGEDVKVGSLATLNTTEKTTVTGAINELESEIDTLQTDLGNLTTTVSANTTGLEILRKFNPTTGSNVALAVDTFGTFDLTKNGNILNIIPNVTNTGAITINPDSQGAKLIKKFNVATDAYVDVAAGDVPKNTPISLAWILASDFFVLAPKGGAPVKSIQRGTASITSTSQTVTITAVVPENSIVLMTQKFFGTNLDTGKIAVEFVNSTTIRFRVAQTPGGAIPVAWQVIEFNNVKSKQSGAKSLTTSTTQTITAVDLTKTFVVATWTNNDANAGYARDTMNVSLSNSTTITFDPETSTSKVCYYQVIEFN